MLSFFMPGYALMLIITKNENINPVAKILFAYLVSILISGMMGHVFALYLDIPISESKDLLVTIHLAILIHFHCLLSKVRFDWNHTQKDYRTLSKIVSYITSKVIFFVRFKISEILIFGSLFTLLVISTYYLFGGITIGDQWFHQGRAFSFHVRFHKRSCSFSGRSIISTLSISSACGSHDSIGLPLVNAYASIAFLNITSILCILLLFIYMDTLQYAEGKMIASTLFATGSGFGWIYVLGLTVTTNPVVSEKSVLETITIDRTV